MPGSITCACRRCGSSTDPAAVPARSSRLTGSLLTNQHVAAGQLQKLSTAGRDLVRDGFFARTRADELKCPDLEALVLVSYEDVTDRVQSAAKPGASDADAAAARRAAIAAIEAAVGQFGRSPIRPW